MEDIYNADLELLIDERLDEQDIYEKFRPEQKRICYIYEVQNLWNNTDEALITFSPNTTKIAFIDKDKFTTVTAFELDGKKIQYLQKQSTSSIDGEIDIVMNDIKNLTTRENLNLKKRKLYVISYVQLLTDEDIYNYGMFLEQANIPNNITSINKDWTSFSLIDFDAWKTRDGHQIILRIGKPIEGDVFLKSIEFKNLKTFGIDHIKVLASSDDDTSLGYANITANTEGWTPLWLLPIEVCETGQVNFYNFWSSELVGNMDMIKKLIAGAGIEELLRIDIGSGWVPKSKSFTNISKINLRAKGSEYRQGKKDSAHNTWDYEQRKTTDNYNILITSKKSSEYSTQIGLENHEKFDVKERFEAVDYGPGGGIFSADQVKFDLIDSIDIFIDDRPGNDSLIKLLKEVLSASFNYDNAFKGAGYNDNGELNEMALYKQRFEGKTIIEYIDSLELKWEKDHPNYTDTKEYKNYKTIRMMLSKYIYGTKSIANGGSYDSQILLLFFLKLISKPIWIGDGKEDDGSGYYEYRTLDANIHSNYFDLKNLKLINNILSSKQKMKTELKTYIWQSMRKNIDQSDLPSLNITDFKLSDNNVTKYLVYYPNLNIEDIFGNEKYEYISKNIFSKNNKFYDFTIDIFDYQKNPKAIELSGIYPEKTIDIKLIFNNENIELNSIPLFKNSNENIGLLNINF